MNDLVDFPKRRESSKSVRGARTAYWQQACFFMAKCGVKHLFLSWRMGVDLATFIGLIGSFAIIAYSMVMGGGIASFFDISSISIVVLGSILVVMTKFGLKQFFGAFKSAGKIFILKKFNPTECIDEAVKIATATRKSGLLALEGIEVKNHFMKRGVQLMIDGHEPDVVKVMLSKDMNLTFERHMVAQKVFRSLAEVAPAMGMIGTLIGLVLMLGNMSDPKMKLRKNSSCAQSNRAG